jgi:hypothetical protein
LEIWNDGMLEYWVLNGISSFQYSIIPASFQPVIDFRSSWLAMPEVFWTPMFGVGVRCRAPPSQIMDISLPESGYTVFIYSIIHQVQTK